MSERSGKMFANSGDIFDGGFGEEEILKMKGKRRGIIGRGSVSIEGELRIGG